MHEKTPKKTKTCLQIDKIACEIRVEDRGAPAPVMSIEGIYTISVRQCDILIIAAFATSNEREKQINISTWQ